MNRICRIAIVVFALAYGAALILLAVGTFGLFGSAKDPLAGVFVILLGLPWNRWIDYTPSSLHPWLAAAAPALNLLLLVAICRIGHFARPKQKVD